jgi:HAD superfamily hydrolase (TIGR01459 family)
MNALKEMKTLPQFYHGIAETMDRYDAYILDIWGVLHDGLRPYDGVMTCLETLKNKGKEILLLSNAPNRAADVRDTKLADFGIKKGVHFDHIITSGEAVWQKLKDEFQGQKAYIFWDQEMPTPLIGLDIEPVYNLENADFMLGSIFPPHAQVEHYTEILNKAKQSNMPFICANPDYWVNIGDALHLCAGGLADHYEEIGGDVLWFGKPHRPVYESAYDMITTNDKTKILAVGDSLRTDVRGANGFGIDVLWNLVGIHWEELRTDPQDTQSDEPAINRSVLKEQLASYQAMPTGLLRGLKL